MTEHKKDSAQARAKKHNAAIKSNSNGRGQRQMHQQPLTDGSEEFFDQFMFEDEPAKINRTNLYIGLGVTLGVITGAGATLWLRKSKKKKSWWSRLFEK